VEPNWLTTDRMPAEILLADGATLDGSLHLQPRVAHRDGGETPLEMLNRPEHFFPVTTAEGGVVFVSKAQVALVRIAPGPATAEMPEEQLGREVGLEVTMQGGTVRRGSARILLPPTRTRALDYVNSQDLFFALRSQEGLLLIGRTHVRLVRPLD
jgi:hypothetical protein